MASITSDLQRFAYVHLAPSLDQMARTYQQAQAGLLPDEPILVVGQPTAFDPTRAPEGKHALWVQVRMAPGTILGDAKGEIIGSTAVAPGVILYDYKALGLCAGMTDARYTTTTEVYPDSRRTTPTECIRAQVAAICAGLDYAMEKA